MTFRLLPKDVRFFDLFIADGENLLEAAARLGTMVEPTTGSTSASPRSRRSRSTATRSTARSTHEARGRVHHAVRPRGHPRADGPPRRRRRRHPGGRRDVRHLRHHPADRRGARAGADPRRAGRRAAARCASSTAEGHRARTSRRSTTSSTRPTRCRGPRSRGSSARRRPDRGHQVARPVPRAREHDRCRRGRGRGDRADVPQGDMSSGRSSSQRRA